jgi:hypothetical protein
LSNFYYLVVGDDNPKQAWAVATPLWPLHPGKTEQRA